ncbi:glycosyltransferase family 4 protein [Treponema pedis]|nr:glycosyltransferase family 4 protein [Treponema pedis]
MKILHCIAQLPMKTGSGVYFTTLVEGLAKKGHTSAVLYGTQKPFSENSFCSLFSESTNYNIKEFRIEFLTADLNFPIAGMSDVMPYTSTVYSEMTEEMFDIWIKNFKQTLLKAKEEFNPDLIITHHLFILTALVKKIFCDKKVIGVCHGTDIRQIKKNGRLKTTYIDGIQSIENLTAYLAVSPKDITEIKNIFSVPDKKLHLVGGGFNPKIFNNNTPHTFDGTFRLIYAGKISQSKGVFELAKTLPVILKKFPNTELTLVGNASEEQKKELYLYAKNSDKLKIHNALTQLEMSNVLKQSDIFILPSYYEALGLIAIEALACGLLAVTTEIEGLINLLGEKANSSGIIEYVKLPRLYDVDKPVEEDKRDFINRLAEKIMLQMTRIKLKENLYAQVSEEIKKHSWDTIIEKIEKIILKS